MFEEMIIQLKSIADLGGFSAVEGAMARLRSSSSTMATSSAASFNNMSGAVGNATTTISQSGTIAAHSASQIHELGTAGKAAAGHLHEIKTAHPHITSVGHAASTASSQVAQLHSSALNARQSLIKIGDARTSILNVGSAANTTSQHLHNSGTAGKSAGNSIASGMSNATNAVAGLGGAVTSVIAGFGLMEIGNMMWTGATERQFNNAYLSMKLGSEQAGVMAEEIEKIVAAVPGDDTFMNNLLGTAAARGAAIEDLKELGYVAADYMIAAQKTGMNSIEAQQDLNSYIMTGTTAELERSRVLAGQVDKLKGKESIHERILALDEALKANEHEGLSQMDIMKIKWETLKGKIQLAATEIGMKILPYLERGVEFLLELDEKTGGWSSTLIIIAGVVLGIGMALGGVMMFLTPLVGGVGALAGAFGLVETAEVGAAAAGWAVLTPLLAIAAMAAIVVTIKIIDDWSRSRFEDPNYVNTLKESGQLTTPENVDTVGRMRGYMMGPGKPLYNMPGMGIAMDQSSQNYEGILQSWEKARDIIGMKPITGQIKSTAGQMYSDAKNWWDKSQSTILNHNIVGDIWSTALDMYNDATRWWNDTTSWITGSDITGRIWSTAQQMYNDAVAWWEQLKIYFDANRIIATVQQAFTAGDAQSMAENASLTPISIPTVTTSTNNKTTVIHETHNHTWNIGAVDSEQTAEFMAKAAAYHLGKLNDVKGR